MFFKKTFIYTLMLIMPFAAHANTIKSPCLDFETERTIIEQKSAFELYNTAHYLEAHAPLVEKAETGDTYAMFLLGMMYKNGAGVTKDLRKGLCWLEEAAGRGEVYAQYNLVYIYAGNPPFYKNLYRSALWANILNETAPDSIIKNYILENEYLLSEADIKEIKTIAKKWKKKREYGIIKTSRP